MTEPTNITKGERVEWTKHLDDYPASLWTLDYRYRHHTGTGINVTATADGDDHLVEIPGTTSDNFTAVGKHEWQAWITEIATPTNTFRIAEGTVNVEAGFVGGSTVAVDTRSQAKIMLDAIDAALLAFASSDVLEYEIETPAGRRKVKRSDKETLTAQRKYWAVVVRRENALEKMRNGKRFGTQMKVRMP